MRRKILALVLALTAVFGIAGVTLANPAAATHTTCKTDNYTPPGETGYIAYSLCWLTNSAHTGVKPYYWTMTNYLGGGETMLPVSMTYVDYPGGVVTTANERLLDSELLSAPSLSYGQGFGQNANVPFNTPPYALITNRPTWRVYVEIDNNTYPVVSRLG